ncbi:hypothetical protein GCM10011610_32570 [Nocardia rhizosphaerihabitans]|uniref:Uncharacterized protein n=1 Tax=Nocardia rhizosphaerihabitans TaxID=1691570 RepID=A0ABQ2KGR4_9NOCA|nr:hypothetical protein GCM10011610_32570 [Nocardia rhizosphaerihabitans]
MLPDWQSSVRQMHRAAGHALTDVPAKVRAEDPVWSGGHRFHRQSTDPDIDTVDILDTTAACLLRGHGRALG